jgi:hypothetical protein
MIPFTTIQNYRLPLQTKLLGYHMVDQGRPYRIVGALWNPTYLKVTNGTDVNLEKTGDEISNFSHFFDDFSIQMYPFLCTAGNLKQPTYYLALRVEGQLYYVLSLNQFIQLDRPWEGLMQCMRWNMKPLSAFRAVVYSRLNGLNKNSKIASRNRFRKYLQTNLQKNTLYPTKPSSIWKGPVELFIKEQKTSSSFLSLMFKMKDDQGQLYTDFARYIKSEKNKSKVIRRK